MRAKPILAIAFGTAAVIAGALNPPAQHGQGSAELIGKAPAFSASTADGKKYDLTTLSKKGSTFLFFIKKDCPVTAGAMDFYKDLYKAYGDKAPILGVMNGDASEFKTYTDEHKLPFPTVLDPETKIVTSYKVENSPWVVEVKADGTVGRIWKGYSQTFLQQMNKAVSDAAGVPIAKIDFTAAPKEARFG